MRKMLSLVALMLCIVAASGDIFSDLVGFACGPLEPAIFFLIEVAKLPPFRFHLYTPKDPAHYVTLKDDQSIRNSSFDPQYETIIFIHGYGNTANDEAIMFIKSKAMRYGSYNFIAVDYREVASSLNVVDILRGVYLVGKGIAQFIMKLQDMKGLDLGTVHIMAWSLGCQVGGAVGNELTTGKVSRITGFDPPGICWDEFSAKRKLDITDASFVDVCKSTGLFFTDEPTGHVMFWVDGGQIARACGDQEANDRYGCSHSKAVYLFGDSMQKDKKCLTVAYKCRDYERYEAGDCFECGTDGRNCAIFGIRAIEYAEKTTTETAIMYVDTTFTDSMCMYQYHVEITLSSSGKTETGRMTLLVTGTEDSDGYRVTLDIFLRKSHTSLPIFETFEPGRTYTYLVNSHEKITKVESISFLWYTSGNSDNRLYVSCVKFEPMNNIETDRSMLRTFATGGSQAGIPPEKIFPLQITNAC